MSFNKLIAWIDSHHPRSRPQLTEQETAEILKRRQELLDPKQTHISIQPAKESAIPCKE